MGVSGALESLCVRLLTCVRLLDVSGYWMDLILVGVYWVSSF